MKTLFKKIIYIYSIIFSYDRVKKISFQLSIISSYWKGLSIKQIGRQSYLGSQVYIKGGDCIEIGNNTAISKGSIITAWKTYHEQIFSPKIQIGNNCSLGEYGHITAINNITIGDNVLTGRWVTISDNSHGESLYHLLENPPLRRPLYSKGAVIIEDNVWIGDKATILAGVKIGRGSVIGANAVVSKDIPPYCVVVGVNKIKELFHN